MSQTINVKASTPYAVHIGEGLLERLGELMPVAGADAVALISDADVLGLHGERARAGLAPLGLRIETFTLEPGESSKSTATLESIWRWMASTGIHRNDCVVALGGGVVGDVAGFAAATYNRGIALVQVPTTVLAQIDSAIGGKTAIDLPEGKNLVGAFHQPTAVVCDVSTLQTLPDAVFNTGMAEVIKHALIANGPLRDLLRDTSEITAREPKALTYLVTHAARVKIDVVEEDETEHGRRAFLNYGHTLAHALETVGGYERFTHGEAVAIGMTFAAKLAVETGRKDLTAEHAALIDAFELPSGGATLPYDEIATAWSRDKKYASGMRFILLEDLGKPVLVSDVPESALRTAYEAVR